MADHLPDLGIQLCRQSLVPVLSLTVRSLPYWPPEKMDEGRGLQRDNRSEPSRGRLQYVRPPCEHLAQRSLPAQHYPQGHRPWGLSARALALTSLYWTSLFKSSGSRICVDPGTAPSGFEAGDKYEYNPVRRGVPSSRHHYRPSRCKGAR